YRDGRASCDPASQGLYPSGAELRACPQAAHSGPPEAVIRIQRGVALVGASGRVAGGDDGDIAIGADLTVVEAERLVPEVARPMPGQPRVLGEGEAERADAQEVVGQLPLKG